MYLSTAQNPGSKDPQVNRRQHADYQTFSDDPKSPQNLNIYNVHVHKMDDKNKVSGHIAPHSVGVSMQGPGAVSLSTTQQVVGSDEAKPDHTVSMVKDTGGCNGPECSMVNVHSGKHKIHCHWLCSPRLRVRFSPGTNVITPFLQKLTQEFEHSWDLGTWNTCV